MALKIFLVKIMTIFTHLICNIFYFAKYFVKSKKSCNFTVMLHVLASKSRCCCCCCCLEFCIFILFYAFCLDENNLVELLKILWQHFFEVRWLPSFWQILVYFFIIFYSLWEKSYSWTYCVVCSRNDFIGHFIT